MFVCVYMPARVNTLVQGVQTIVQRPSLHLHVVYGKLKKPPIPFSRYGERGASGEARWLLNFGFEVPASEWNHMSPTCLQKRNILHLNRHQNNSTVDSQFWCAVSPSSRFFSSDMSNAERKHKWVQRNINKMTRITLNCQS